MKRIVLGPMDGSVTLRTGETLEDMHVVRMGSWFGRVLFTTYDPLVLVEGERVTVRRCTLEAQGYGDAVRVRTAR